MKPTLTYPFSIKFRSKLHPERLLYTARARFEERISRIRFRTYQIPMFPPGMHSGSAPDYNQSETAVTPDQMSALLCGVHETNHLTEPIVEVGAYRGVTTETLARTTPRRLFAVDPYAGYGGAEDDFIAFRERTRTLENLVHLRETSGAASQRPELSLVSFVFVDAVHDYVNAFFDGVTWSRKLTQNGLIAFHDTDTTAFPGVTRAVWEILNLSELHLVLHTHVPGLIVLKRV